MCKRQLILEYLSNIKDVFNRELIFSFIKLNNINYVQNRNGIFFNLSILDENMIIKLYDYITSLEKEKEIKIIKKQEYKKVNKSINKTPKYKNYNLNELDKLILQYSH